MGSESKFLEYNKDNIFINLIQAEDHFRHLESGAAGRGEFLSCISKHLANVEGETGEAISHSLIVEGSRKSREYAEVRDAARNLRKRIQRDEVESEEGIREIRDIRRRFEAMNPLFDTSRCKTCGSAEEFMDGFRRGNPNIAKAMGSVEKGLYPSASNDRGSEHTTMVSRKEAVKDIALIIGGANIGYGIGIAAKTYIDPLAPGAIMGQDPSLLIEGVGVLAGLYGAYKIRNKDLAKLSGLIAAGLSIPLIEDFIELVVPVPITAAAVGAVGIPAIPAYPTPAPRLAGYPFPSPVAVGGTMSPPHYTLNDVHGAPKTIALAPKYMLSS